MNDQPLTPRGNQAALRRNEFWINVIARPARRMLGLGV
jgi:hypothetical protein